MNKKPIENKPSPNDERKEENGIHPLYPSFIEHPFKGVQGPGKPSKKPTKTDTKFTGSPQLPTKTGVSPNKFDFDPYDSDDKEHHKHDHDLANGSNEPSIGPGPGPGFFNPSLTKHQYADYDQAIYQNGGEQQKPSKPNQFNPYLIPHGDNRQELLNILGGNGPQNLPPHLRIEHILQQFQGNGDGEQTPPPFGNPQQNQNGLNYQFGIGQQPTGNGQPQGKLFKIFASYRLSLFVLIYFGKIHVKKKSQLTPHLMTSWLPSTQCSLISTDFHFLNIYRWF